MAIARRFVLTNASCAENGVMWKFSCATNSWKTASDMFYVICLCYWQDIIIGTQKQLSISAQNYQITDKFKNLWMFKIWSPPVTNCIFYNPINWRLIFTSQHLQHIFRFTHLCSRAFSHTISVLEKHFFTALQTNIAHFTKQQHIKILISLKCVTFTVIFGNINLNRVSFVSSC